MTNPKIYIIGILLLLATYIAIAVYGTTSRTKYVTSSQSGDIYIISTPKEKILKKGDSIYIQKCIEYPYLIRRSPYKDTTYVQTIGKKQRTWESFKVFVKK